VNAISAPSGDHHEATGCRALAIGPGRALQNG
jgi:hypothetical protein